ncbi:unnamed protein product [Durusdinium trenchii]|uniref:Uncharacterized protein n=1 Tax=Durusdinium trenchii TaxID=1381693 RepID=A0ABP0QPU1_9DINO
MEQNSRATQLAELIEQQPRARFKGGQHLCASLQFDHLLTGNRLLQPEEVVQAPEVYLTWEFGTRLSKLSVSKFKNKPDWEPEEGVDDPDTNAETIRLDLDQLANDSRIEDDELPADVGHIDRGAWQHYQAPLSSPKAPINGAAARHQRLIGQQSGRTLAEWALGGEAKRHFDYVHNTVVQKVDLNRPGFAHAPTLLPLVARGGAKGDDFGHCSKRSNVSELGELGVLFQAASRQVEGGVDEWLQKWCTEEVLSAFLQASSKDSAVASLSTALCWRKKHRSVLTGARVPSWQGDMRVVARGESGHPVTHSCRSVFLHSQFFCMSNRWKVGDGCHNSPEEGYTTWIWVTFGFARAEMRQIYHAKAWSR